TPATDGGQVFVGTRDGKVYAFGNPVGSPLKGGPVEFGLVSVGGSASTDVVLTENQSPSQSLGIRGVTVDGDAPDAEGLGRALVLRKDDVGARGAAHRHEPELDRSALERAAHRVAEGVDLAVPGADEDLPAVGGRG